jgi:membrane protein DedA with SNARE-associated domain
MDLERFILEYGAWSYLITVVWTFFEGETFVLLAGFVAARGSLSATLLIMAAALGSFAGDQCYFWIGRHFGLRLMARHPDWRRRVDTALSWLRRWDVGFILTFRFIYGVRNFSSFALGVSSINWKRFLSLNFIAAWLWAATFVGLGFVCGKSIEHVLGRLAHEVGIILLGLFVALLAGGHLVGRLRRSRRRVAEAAATPP